MTPRSYQLAAHAAVLEHLASNDSTLLVAATGTGKTVLFGMVARDWPEGRVLIIAHRDELIRQAADKVGRICGEPCAIEMGLDRSNEGSRLYRSRVVVSSVQTMSRDRRRARFNPDDFGLVVFDEAHHATASTYLKVWNHFSKNPACKLLGVTATPDRHDEEALGRVFETCCFEYGVKDAIDDGWLVPIQQRYVWVDGLDFSKCRTTAGDLNQGDLAKIMEDEKSLHGVVIPTVDIAGDRKTLVFTASVAHAERACEIANRYKPGSSVWLCGETPKDYRREIVRAYARGDFQFLFNCGIALEGFDDPGIEVVAVARPTKSRPIYSQILGRGTRPLPGIVDGIETAEDRRSAIAASAKPHMLALDFVGNSGKHKLIHAADILGAEYDEQWLEEAIREIEKKSKAGEDIDVEEAFRLAEEQRERVRLQREKEEEEVMKAHAEWVRKLDEADKRRSIKATADYNSRPVDPFNVFQIAPPRETTWSRNQQPTERMLNVIRKGGVPEPEIQRLTKATAGALVKEITRRWEAKLCTYKQAKLLKQFGYTGNETMAEAGAIITQLKANGWRRPVAV